jgi:hypothetical protein
MHATPAATPKGHVATATKTVQGSQAQADRWGTVQVALTVRKTTTTVGTKKTVTRKITEVQVPVYPNHTDRSVFINQQAIPLLVQEELQAQFDLARLEAIGVQGRRDVQHLQARQRDQPRRARRVSRLTGGPRRPRALRGAARADERLLRHVRGRVTRPVRARRGRRSRVRRQRRRGHALRGTWRVGIQHPLERRAIAAAVEATDLALATSGEYARGRHVLDPHTGAPPGGILSATISGPDLATADAYATAAFAMGARVAPHWLARLRGYGALLILDDERVLSTPSFGCARR